MPDGPRHTASPIADTDFVPDGRAAHVPDVSLSELHWAAARVDPSYFRGEGVLWVGTEGNLIRVVTVDGRSMYFRPVIGAGLPNVAETTVRAGTPQDPHVTVVNHRVAPEQLTRAWVHEITETIHMRAALDQQRPQGVVRRFVDTILRAFGRERAAVPTPHADPTHGEGHVRARLNERELLLRRFQAARTPLEQMAIRQELMGIDHELARMGYPAHQLPFPAAGPRTAPPPGPPPPPRVPPPPAPHAAYGTAPPVTGPHAPTPHVPAPRTPTVDGHGTHVPRHAAPPHHAPPAPPVSPHHAPPAPPVSPHHAPPAPPVTPHQGPPAPPPPGPNPADYGYLNERGYWEFTSDQAGEAFGENLLGEDFLRLPPDQQIAIREYTRHSWPYNTVARGRDADDALRQWWADGGTADLVRGLFGGHVPTVADIYARAQRNPAPGTFERWLVDTVLAQPPTRQAEILRDIVADDGARGMLIRSFGGRFPTAVDLWARIALIDDAMRATPLRYPVSTMRGLQEVNFMRSMLGDTVNFQRGPDGRWLNEYGQPLTVDDIRRHLVGTTQRANGYMSTSLGVTSAFRGSAYPFRLVLEVPRGNPAIWMGSHSVYPDQRELVLPRDARYTITGVRQTADGTFELLASVREARVA